MKYELRIEFKDTKLFIDYIKKTYKNGILNDRSQKITFNKETDIFKLCKGLNSIAVRLYNEEIIDGALRCILIEKEDEISFFPCSLYCEQENNKYSFSI